MPEQFLTDEERSELVATRRDIHMHPELKYEERRTAALVAERLRALDIAVTEGVAETGVVGLIEGGRAGRTVLLRADMDALPVHEANEIDYRSRADNRMHACGHDAHTAIGLTVARRLAAERATLPGAVKMVFQPAEEGGAGALRMVEEGVLDAPHVDAVFGLHMWNNIPVGKVGVVAGPMMASVDEVTITVRGVGGHGAMPHQAVDPIVAASHVVVALQSVVARNVSPLDAAVVTIGSFHAGDAFNVIPEQAVLRGTVRTFDPALYARIPEYVERVVRGACEALGASYTLDYKRTNPPTVNDPAMAALVADVAAEVVGRENVVSGDAARTMGGEDFAFMLDRRPGCYFFVGSRNESKGLVHPHHSPLFDIDEDALPIGAEILTRLAHRFLA